MSNFQQQLEIMTLAEKAGQLFLLAFAENRLDEARILFEENLVGGAYISNDNIPTPQAAIDLTQELQGYAKNTRLQIPLLLGVDQEGSWGVMVDGSTTGPGNMALGATNNPQAAYEMYQVLAKELRAVGLNTLLAPCADCNSNPHNAIIGMRAFGEFPELVGHMTASAVKGTQDAGVIGTVKHFPGHGDTTTDSHRGLPTVNRTRDELLAIDLHPFVEGINAGVSIVMTAHILFPALDPDHPATLSSIILQDVLRDEMGFDGLILSDSMNMKAMKANYDPVDSAIRAIRAGVDMIMLAEEHYDHNAEQYLQQQQALIQGVIQAVESGDLDSSRVDDAVSRILKLKDAYNIDAMAERKESAIQIVGSAEHRQVELEVSQQAVVILQDRAEQIPLATDTDIILVNSSLRASYEGIADTRGIGPNQAKPAFDTFAEAMQTTFESVSIVSAEEVIDGTEVGNGLVIVVTENYPLPGMDFDKSSQATVIQKVVEQIGDEFIVVALRDPYGISELPDVATILCGFSFRPSTTQAIVNVLSGKVEAKGQSPVSYGS